MRKYFPLLLLLIIFLATSLNLSAQSSSVSQEEGVEEVILDKTEAILACPGLTTINLGHCNEEARKIRIRTVTKNAEKKGLTFYYLTTGGKIIGEGKDVIWDFTDAKVGNYSITIGVGKNGSLKGNFITKSVRVKACECDLGYECPSISILGPTAPADVGDTLIFTVEVAGGSQEKVAYNWQVTSGTIVLGQGTSQILVKPDKNKKVELITATADIAGIYPLCQRTASASAEIKDK